MHMLPDICQLHVNTHHISCIIITYNAATIYMCSLQITSSSLPFSHHNEVVYDAGFVNSAKQEVMRYGGSSLQHRACKDMCAVAADNR